MTSRDQLQETLCKRLFWHTAERDDAKVADHIFHHREMDVVYAMDEATLFDSFFKTFDRYDDRSLMENKLFREVKQNWHFEHPPKKTKEGVYVQAYMTMGMKALTTAFLKWQEKQLQLQALGKDSTWQMYRRKLKVLNRNKLIVFVDNYFGISPSHEVFMLANVPVHDIAKELNITREQVYAKYTEQPIAENFRSGLSGFLSATPFLV